MFFVLKRIFTHAGGWHKQYFFGGAQAQKCTPVAPGLLLSFRAQSSFGGHISRLEGTSSDLGGRDPKMPPRGAGPVPHYYTDHYISLRLGRNKLSHRFR